MTLFPHKERVVLVVREDVHTIRLMDLFRIIKIGLLYDKDGVGWLVGCIVISPSIV